jgi:hypothetical protein
MVTALGLAGAVAILYFAIQGYLKLEAAIIARKASASAARTGEKTAKAAPSTQVGLPDPAAPANPAPSIPFVPSIPAPVAAPKPPAPAPAAVPPARAKTPPHHSVSELLRRIVELQRVNAEWTAIFQVLNPDNHAETLRHLNQLRGPHMFIPHVGLNVLEEECRRIAEFAPRADCMTAFRAAAKTMERLR